MNDDCPVQDFSNRVAENRMCPGILMFDTSLRVLWSDRRAWELCRTLRPKSSAQGSKVVPAPIKAICVRITESVKQKAVKELSSPLVREIVKGTEDLLICGFAIPHEETSEDAKILIVMERVGRREEAAAELAKHIYRLTQREVQVIQHLMKGWSNKEIAQELNVTEQTVKEHLQRIMTKTQSLSRTGIVARVLLL